MEAPGVLHFCAKAFCVCCNSAASQHFHWHYPSQSARGKPEVAESTVEHTRRPLSTMMPTNKSIQTFELDVNLSAKTKAETLKFLAVLLKNLMEKGDDPKYRQVRLSNPKIHRLAAHPSILSYLQQAGHFAQVFEDGETFLRCTTVPNATQLQTALAEVEAAKVRVELSMGGLDESSYNTGLLSEKQKARQLREEAEKASKAADKRARMDTVSQIAADKHVRENDPNWKPSVSAAAAKAGDAMMTFRDKYGES
jgi:PUB domain